ncbi:MAG: dethiobiotin synthase [Pseudomonadota bacterium]
MTQGYFITGTDTGVGKTLIACALLHAYSARGLRVIGMKPVAAGAMRIAGRLINDDVTALQAASTIVAPGRLVNPYCFEAPIAPHIAASLEGLSIEIELLHAAYAELSALADRVIVEGAGGFRVPLSANHDTADLARRLQLPVVLVVGMRLGCINHALLTASAIAAAGLKLAGWIANHVDPSMLRMDENIDALQSRLHAPLLARIPYVRSPHAREFASLLDIKSLF